MKCKKKVFWENTRNYFRVDFFYFSSLGLKVAQVPAYVTTGVGMQSPVGPSSANAFLYPHKIK